MNQLIAKERPGYNVIPDFFIKRFECQVIESYMLRMEDRQFLRLHLPVIDDDLLFNDAVHPEVHAAAYLGFTECQKDYFFNVTKGKSPGEVFDMARAICEGLEERPDMDFDDCLYEDIKTLLNVHHMSFIDIFEGGLLGRGYGYFYKNLPIGQVW